MSHTTIRDTLALLIILIVFVAVVMGCAGGDTPATSELATAPPVEASGSAHIQFSITYNGDRINSQVDWTQEGPFAPDDAVIRDTAQHLINQPPAGREATFTIPNEDLGPFSVHAQNFTGPAHNVPDAWRAWAQVLLTRAGGSTVTPVTPAEHRYHSDEGMADPTQWTELEYNRFFSAVLYQLHIDPRAETLAWLHNWSQYENTKAAWNPLATTRKLGAGETNFNTANVKSYLTFDDGVRATAETLALPYYVVIRQSLKAGEFVDGEIGNELCRWGTKALARTFGVTCGRN